jgi:uncharacterized protein (DUF433 family)
MLQAFQEVVQWKTLSLTMNWKDHITSDPSIMFGKMVIKGTRIPVSLLLEKLAAGFSTNDLLQALPSN